ncbi:MAG TPA: hypothetical protein VMJ10_31780 [Kofleriaceae bacterium]|nr:hypothetical protein [Kofleriaceae bacterium]
MRVLVLMSLTACVPPAIVVVPAPPPPVAATFDVEADDGASPIMTPAQAPSTTTPSPPAPAPPAPGPVAGTLGAERVEWRHADPRCGVRLGFRVQARPRSSRPWLLVDFDNTTDVAIQIPAADVAELIDREREAIVAVADPGTNDEWFMPFTVPAHSHRTVRLTTSGGDPSKLAHAVVPLESCMIDASPSIGD